MTGEYTGRFGQAETVTALQRIGGELKPAVKTLLTSKDLEWVRRAYAHRLATLQAPVGVPTAEAGRNGS